MFKPTKPQHITNKKYFNDVIPEPPSAEGTYSLMCTVSSSGAIYFWAKSNITVTTPPSTDQNDSVVEKG